LRPNAGRPAAPISTTASSCSERRRSSKYVDALQGGPEWETLRERERIALVWVRPERGLARRLEVDPLWSVLYRDRMPILFARRDVRSDAASSVATLRASRRVIVTWRIARKPTRTG
jgi:hypothetical protein